jgi:hypothetical protein
MEEHHTHGTSLKKSVYAKSACLFQEIGEINLPLHFPDLSKIFRQALLHESQRILAIDRLHINLLKTTVNTEHTRFIGFNYNIARTVLRSE